MRRRRRLLLELVAIAALIGALTPIVNPRVTPPARALSTCGSPQKNYFDGFYSSWSDNFNGNYEGASATLVNNSANICDDGSHDFQVAFNYVWVGVFDGSQSHNAAHAQIGFYRGWGRCTVFAWETQWFYNGPFARNYGPFCLGANTSNHYWVQFEFNQLGGYGDFRLNVDNSVMYRTPWNPFNSGWAQPFSTQFNGETTYVGTDIPTSHFSGMQVQQSNGAWAWATYGQGGPYYYDSCPQPARYVKWAHVTNNEFGIQTSGSSYALNCP